MRKMLALRPAVAAVSLPLSATAEHVTVQPDSLRKRRPI